MIYRKFKICEENLTLAGQQLYRHSGRVPTRTEAAEWFRDWVGQQRRTYSVNPALMFAAFLIGCYAVLVPLALTFQLFGSDLTGVPGLLAGICALAGGAGSVVLLFMAYDKYEAYRWKSLIERRSSEDVAWTTACLGINCGRGEYYVGGTRFDRLDDAVEYVRRTRG